LTAWAVAWCFAGGFTHRPSREPLPAREVERPLVLPSGWTELTLGGAASGSLGAGARLSLGSGVEVAASAPWSSHQGAWGASSPTLGAAWSPWAREAPSRSVCLRGRYTPGEGASGFGPEAATGVARAEARRQWGGLQLDGGVGLLVAGRVASPHAVARVVGQAGPLLVFAAAEADAAWLQPFARWGGAVQLNRAITARVSREVGREGATTWWSWGLAL
jgi:hypothetical protein